MYCPCRAETAVQSKEIASRRAALADCPVNLHIMPEGGGIEWKASRRDGIRVIGSSPVHDREDVSDWIPCPVTGTVCTNMKRGHCVCDKVHCMRSTSCHAIAGAVAVSYMVGCWAPCDATTSGHSHSMEGFAWPLLTMVNWMPVSLKNYHNNTLQICEKTHWSHT